MAMLAKRGELSDFVFVGLKLAKESFLRFQQNFVKGFVTLFTYFAFTI